MLKHCIKFLRHLVVLTAFSAAQAGQYDEFFSAVANDNPSVMSTWFLRGVDPNVRDDKGQVALFLALRDGHFRAVAQLLSHPDIKLDLANATGETPLMMAALKGHVDVMRQLLARKVPADREGWSPLHYAASGPETRAVQLLLDSGAVLDVLSPNGSTPLMMAARYGAEDSARLLLKRGANPRLRNERDLQASDFAKLANREALAEELARAAQR